MKTTAPGNPDQLVLCLTFDDSPARGQLGIVAACGLVVLALGAVLAWRRGPGPIALLLLAAGTLVAALFLLARRAREGHTLDRKARTVTAWHSLIVPLGQTTGPLPDVTTVTIGREGAATTTIVLPGELPLLSTALTVGTWLALGVCFLAGLHELLRNWAGLAPWIRPVADVVGATVLVLPQTLFLLALLRHRGRTRISVSPQEFRIVLAGVPRGQVTAMSAAEIEEVILHPARSGGDEVRPALHWLAGSLRWLLPWALDAMYQAHSALSGPLDAAITVRSDRTCVSFGAVLAADERVYLHALILRALAGAQQARGANRPHHGPGPAQALF